MIEILKQLDTNIFLFFNGLHFSWLDYPMWLISGHLVWIPIYLLIIFLAFKKLSKTALLAIPFIILTFVCSDIVSDLIKHLVQRFRPTHNLLIGDIVHTVSGYRGGMFGFVSSHAANTFGVATFTVLLLKNNLSLLFFIWPIFVSYSRIYLGVHYPADLLGGAITGSFIAIMLYYIFLFSERKFFPKRHNKFFYSGA